MTARWRPPAVELHAAFPTMGAMPHTFDTDPPPHPSGVDYESSPLDRNTYVTAIIHLYRGEMARANAWRQRLDQTTNWAIFTTATALGFAFNDQGHSHFSLQFANLLLLTLLQLEARRFRFFDVWRARVRKIEENFYGPILRRDPESPEAHWGELVARDLLAPRFKITRFAAVRARLVRNYWAIYAVLLVTWVVHVLTHPKPAQSWEEIRAHLSGGLVPWWVPVACVSTVLVGLVATVVFAPRSPESEREYWSDRSEDSSELDLIDV